MLETYLTPIAKQNDSEQFNLLKDPSIPISTEGIKYSGSKLKLLPYILSVVHSLPVKRILDGFSGTTRVSQALAKCDYQVIANDLAVWSKVFGECYLKGKKSNPLQEKIDYLNSLKGYIGWFSEYYGGKANGGLSLHSDGKKKIWQIHNTKKLDAIRPEIDKVAESSVEKSILLTSLILALDKVDSTLGHYASYLREWSPRSFNKVKLLMPLMETKSSHHKVMNKDIFQVLRKVKVDLSYFDPPYGSNNEKMPPSRVRYASYYHVWKTICLNDEPELSGKTNRRTDCNDRVAGSVFEEFRKNTEGEFIALKAIEKLIKECSSPYILLSYNNGGRATKEEICEIISKQCKKAHIFSIDYKRNVMSGMRWTYDWTKTKEGKNIEFLFLMEK
ncbi:MAG: DNA adenine methylase [Bdellovibrionales bacterium]|nr:DNA adenine methylase [Bdellovibrionales bacterium]